jgi:hypothetical protein
MMVSKIVEMVRSDRIIPIFSFLIGMGTMVMLFHKPYTVENTLALPVDDIEGKIVKQGNRCYIYHAEDTACELVASR